MKTLKNFEKELNKCSKCGLCQNICPIFKLTKNECTVSKGKFMMLLGVTKGDLELSDNINKYIDMCLKCGKCKDFCPSGIDVCQILNFAKHDYMKNKFSSKIINFIQSRQIFSSIIRFLQIFNHYKRVNKSDKNALNLLYFKGCVNQIFPNTDKYIDKIFKKYPLNIIEPNFECCGLPFLSEGNIERFQQVAQYNALKFNTNYDFLITDCASCEDTILNYGKYIDNFNINNQKLINWGELIAQKGIQFKYKRPIKVTFHKPCHLKNDDFFEKIIKNCENIEYIKMKDYDECCGFAGSFGIKNHKLSKEISKQKGEKIIQTKADFVITTCPSCLIGLNQGLLLNRNNTKVVSLLEFLSKADEIL